MGGVRLVILLGLMGLLAACVSAPAGAPPRFDPREEITAPGTTVVGRGETLLAVARRTGVEPDDLARANGLSPPFTLEAGQRLRIPRQRYHEVTRGETLSSIAQTYRVPTSKLARLNGLRAPYAVQAGTRLRLPGSEIAAAPPPPVRRTARAPASPDRHEAQRQPPRRQSAQRPRPPADTDRAVVAVPREAPAFVWPLDGRLLARFGPKPNGTINDGINIAATRGAPVRAAAAGTIVYADNGLPGFGWLILIQHGNGWITTYGHNDELLVKRGDTVARGETIARAGSTGSVTEPQLHFEIRFNRRPLDPLRLLPSRDLSLAPSPAALSGPG